MAEEDRSDYITTTRGLSGWFAIRLRWYDDIDWFDVHSTGTGRYRTREEAAEEAKEWAKIEGIAYRA